ncbi:MAG: hypothetical protein U0836_27375 [Pirellulales bacterium]
MNLRWKLALGCCVVALPLVAQVGAQDEEAEVDPQKLYRELDKNNDGTILPSEVTGKNRALVNRLIRNGDTNSDKSLSKDEFFVAYDEDKKRPQEEEPEAEPNVGGPQPGMDPTAMLNPQVVFAQLDRTRDQMITLEELAPVYRQMLGPVLSRLDRTGDGGIDQREFLAGWPAVRTVIAGMNNQVQNNLRAGQGNPLFQALDTDNSGSLSAEEIDAAPDALRKLDANGDGVVELTEIGPRMGPAAGAADRRATAQAAGADRLVKRYMQSDADKDGKLSEEEAPAALKKQFGQLDKDGDGFLDTDELRASRGREEGRSRRATRRGREAADDGAAEQ